MRPPEAASQPEAARRNRRQRRNRVRHTGGVNSDGGAAAGGAPSGGSAGAAMSAVECVTASDCRLAEDCLWCEAKPVAEQTTTPGPLATSPVARDSKWAGRCRPQVRPLRTRRELRRRSGHVQSGKVNLPGRCDSERAEPVLGAVRHRNGMQRRHQLRRLPGHDHRVHALRGLRFELRLRQGTAALQRRRRHPVRLHGSLRRLPVFPERTTRQLLLPRLLASAPPIQTAAGLADHAAVKTASASGTERTPADTGVDGGALLEESTSGRGRTVIARASRFRGKRRQSRCRRSRTNRLRPCG